MDRVYEVDAADALARFATSSKHPLEERTRAIAYLAEAHRKAPPWDGHWWGTQPAAQKPPQKTIAWEATPRITTTIRELLSDRMVQVRSSAVEAIVQMGSQESKDLLRARFSREKTRP